DDPHPDGRVAGPDDSVYAGGTGVDRSAQPPPVTADDSDTTTPAAVPVDFVLAGLVSTPLLCAAGQLAFAQRHYAGRGITTAIPVPDIDTIHVAALPHMGLTAAEFAYHARGHATLGEGGRSLPSPPADGGWVDNPRLAELVARLLDDTDPSDLVFLATS